MFKIYSQLDIPETKDYCQLCPCLVVTYLTKERSLGETELLHQGVNTRWSLQSSSVYSILEEKRAVTAILYVNCKTIIHYQLLPNAPNIPSMYKGKLTYIFFICLTKSLPSEGCKDQTLMCQCQSTHVLRLKDAIQYGFVTWTVQLGSANQSMNANCVVSTEGKELFLI